jgi:hypothetical protein
MHTYVGMKYISHEGQAQGAKGVWTHVRVRLYMCVCVCVRVCDQEAEL